MLHFLRKSLEKNGVSPLVFDWEESTTTFVQSQILSEVSGLVEDILECYIFEEKSFNNVYPYEEHSLKKASLSIKDILTRSFLGKRQCINKVRLKNDLVEVKLLVSQELGKDGLIDFADLGRIKPEKTLFFEEIFTESKIQLLQRCFVMLWNLYQRMKRQDLLDQKLIFKMHGFHALFTEPKNAEESYICKENKRLISENIQSILNGSGGIIDAQDTIGLFGNNDKLGFLTQIDTIYSEIARLLKVPLTRLLGRSPQGFNATGHSDAYNYDLTLDRYRSGWLEPFLQQMQIKYHKVAKCDIAYLEKILNMHKLCDIPIQDDLKMKIQALSANL